MKKKFLASLLLGVSALAPMAYAEAYYEAPSATEFVIYYDNSGTNWQQVNIHYWNSPQTTWPGVALDKVDGDIWKYTFTQDASGLAGFLFCNGDGSDQTADKLGAPVNGHLYKGSGGKGAVTDEGVYDDEPDPGKPVVTADPVSGTRFTDDVTVTLSVVPAATIYYTTDGVEPSVSSTVYSSALVFTETTTLRTLAVTADGVRNEQSFTYIKRAPVPEPGGNLVTDYYKVNPDGKVGSFRTVNMSFNGQKSSTAMGNWTDADLIAQGVARDVAQAMKGYHERPIIDSYALYAAYDNDYLYLGAQFVYTVWDLYGEGKQPGESKPYNMDGRMVWAFDLDPDKSFDGYINGTGAIWNDNGGPGAKFANGVDAMWIGSTKPGVGTPGLFLSTPDGHASYDAAYCKSISGSYYGYADGVLPSIDKIWGQGRFGYDPEDLVGNGGFVDLSGEIDKSAHTFYEWKLPLSTLGITADYIKNNGIGVMYLDIYGSSPVGGTPYDPSYFDNVKDSYSMDPSSSKEKEDEDVITFAPARIGKLRESSAIESVAVDEAGSFNVTAGAGSLSVTGAEDSRVMVAGIDGKVYFNDIAGADVTIALSRGVYIVNVGGKSVKAVVK